MNSTFRELPSRAAYLHLSNPSRRNALSLNVLKSLRSQLIDFNTSPLDSQLRLLPPFLPDFLKHLEDDERSQVEKTHSIESLRDQDYSWLVSARAWRDHRSGLPKAIVLAPSGPVFSAGHDLRELSNLSRNDVKETFAICADVMRLIRRSPAPVIAVVQGLATAAGAQLALSADYTIALRDTRFMLPGMSISLPCTSPSTAISRKLGNARAFRMLSMPGEGLIADEIKDAVDCVDVDLTDAHGPEEISRRRENALWARAQTVIGQISEKSAGQPQALGKWAFWTQTGLRSYGKGESSGDGYEAAVDFAGGVMALHAQSEDAREGMLAFSEKRTPVWKT